MKKKKQLDETTPENTEESAPPKKQVKVIYIDDNSTIADMSRTRGAKRADRPKSTFREKARTFFAAQKSMLLPLAITLAGFGIVFLIFFLIGRFL